MRTIILGAGTAGLQLAKRITETGKDAVLIEKDADIVRIAANAFDCMVIHGDANSPEILAQAGFGKAEAFVALTGNDAVNIVSCAMVAAEYPHVKRVARVHNPYFMDLTATHGRFMGVDKFVNPDIETAKAFLTLIAQGADEDTVLFDEKDLELRTLVLNARSPFAGKPLKDSRAAIGQSFLVAALERNERIEIPSGETVPLEGDTIYLLGREEILNKIAGKKKPVGKLLRKVVITDGGPIGKTIAARLSGNDGDIRHFIPRFGKSIKGREVILIEKSMDICKQVSRELPSVLVLNRDIAEEDVFGEENLGTADLFVAAGRNQELNILSAGRAKLAGVDKTLALTENSSYLELSETMNIDGILSIKSNIVTSIMEYLRGGNLKTLHSFWDRGIKILEFTIPKDSPLHDMTVSAIKLPKAALLLFIHRDSANFLPNGDTTVHSGDRLAIFTSMDAIGKVEAIFLEGGI